MGIKACSATNITTDSALSVAIKRIVYCGSTLSLLVCYFYCIPAYNMHTLIQLYEVQVPIGDRQTDGEQKDRQTERQIDRQTDRQSYGVHRCSRFNSFDDDRLNEWNKLSTDCVTASSVNVFKNKVDTYLRRAGYK